MCAGFRQVCEEQPDTAMVALHLPYAQLHEWLVGMEAHTFHAIPGCITIGSTSPPAYSPTIVHTPLGGSDTFFLWRTKDAPRPTHNVFAVAMGE